MFGTLEKLFTCVVMTVLEVHLDSWVRPLDTFWYFPHTWEFFPASKNPSKLCFGTTLRVLKLSQLDRI
jgi:hypothetical protein